MKLIFSVCICAYDYITSREQSPRRIIASDSTLHEIMLYWLLWKQFGQLCAAAGYARVLFGSIVCISDNSLEFGPADNGSIPCLAFGLLAVTRNLFCWFNKHYYRFFPLSSTSPGGRSLRLGPCVYVLNVTCPRALFSALLRARRLTFFD